MSSKPIEIHFEKSLNNLNLVQEADVGQRREFLIVTALVILMALGILAYGWQHYQNLDLGYQIEAAEKERVQLTRTRDKLRIEHQSLRSSGNIDARARRMGLVELAPGQLIAASGKTSGESEPELEARK